METPYTPETQTPHRHDNATGAPSRFVCGFSLLFSCFAAAMVYYSARGLRMLVVEFELQRTPTETLALFHWLPLIAIGCAAAVLVAILVPRLHKVANPIARRGAFIAGMTLLFHLWCLFNFSKRLTELIKSLSA